MVGGGGVASVCVGGVAPAVEEAVVSAAGAVAV